MNRFLRNALLILTFTQISGAVETESVNRPERATVISCNSQSLTVSFNLKDYEENVTEINDTLCHQFSMRGEGFTYTENHPCLPMVNRFVVVPPSAGLELIVEFDEPERIAVNHPITCYSDDIESVTPVNSIISNLDISNSSIYPPCVAEMSDPVVIRGVRVVKITTYPFRYDFSTQQLLHYPNITTEVRFNNNPPVNPAYKPVRKNRSAQFLNYIRNLALNGDEVGRDDPDQQSEYVGHYAVVGHENCLQFVRPFIEWRRRAGWKVDLISLNRYQAADEDFVKEQISDLYESYLDDDIDPFDHILLIGDREHYLEPPRPNWVLEAPRGESIWNHGAQHADYLYACLEGGDRYPDAAINRWGSGYQDMMELAVGRTLMYEATPDMDDESWFTRGCAYSQHWGNNRGAGWHPSLATCAQWGAEVLERCGFDDITYYENHDWDQWGEDLFPVLRDVFNDGANVMIGRAQNYQWRYDFDGVNDNTAFPINIFVSGHGEGPADMMFRVGSGDHLKGTVASIFGWGAPTTVPMSAVWLEVVSGFMLNDMTLGWARNWAITSIESYIPDYDWRGSTIYLHIKSDIDAYGDPAIQPWIGVPKSVEADFPETIHPLTKHIEVYVADLDRENHACGIPVTLYAPGNLPDDLDDYVDYDDMVVQTRFTDDRGIARFDFPGEMEFESGTTMFVTVTGRNVCPFLGEMEITIPDEAVDLAEYTLNEVDGNGDNEINPGEEFELAIVAQNISENNLAHNVQAVVRSASPWVVVSTDTILFGDIEPEDWAEGDRDIQVQIHDSCPDGMACPDKRPVLEVDFSNGETSWTSSIILEPQAPCFSFVHASTDVIGDNNRLLEVTIRNSGNLDASELEAQLFAVSNAIIININESTYPAMRVSRSARQDGSRFSVRKNPSAIPGEMCRMLLVLREMNSGFIDTVGFVLQAGAGGEGDPQGPDDGGYVCYDDTDSDWDEAPQYNWIEISLDEQDRDFDGTRIGFDGNSPCNMGEARVVPLDFDLGFYGCSYNTITVATNGFITVGSQPRIVNFQKWPMDRAIGGGVGMIAPFWQDLELEENSDVYYYFDEDNHRFIIEWDNLRNRSNNRTEITFEVVLYDPDFGDNPDGNSDIVFQYKSIENARNNRQGESDWEESIPFASVGISNPDGTCGINYTFAGQYASTSAVLENRRAIAFRTYHQVLDGELYGTVVNSENELPMDGVHIETSYGLSVDSDENGDWRIENAVANLDFSITASLEGYNPSIVSDLNITPDEELEINFSLNHPEIGALIDSFDVELNSDQQLDLDLILENTGNGNLDWNSETILNDEDTHSWWFRSSVYTERETGDNDLKGVVFTGDNYILSGSNGDEPGMIYVLDASGEFEYQFEQPGDSETGMLDLAWDGELVWGSGENSVFGLGLEGDVVTEFQGPHVNNRSIAWDVDNEYLWIAGNQTDIIAVDREGIQQQIIQSRQMRIIGMAYRSEPEEDYPLYVLHSPGVGQYLVTRINPSTEDTSLVCRLLPQDGGQPLCASINDLLFDGCWSFITVSDDIANRNGDRIDCWRMNLLGDDTWLLIDPIEGSVEPLSSQQINVHINAHNLREGLHEGLISVDHNAAGPIIEIDVSLYVNLLNPPSPFNLLEPEDLDTLSSGEITFRWGESFDPDDNDAVSYLLHIGHNEREFCIPNADTSLILRVDTLGFDLNREIPFNWWVHAVSDQDTVHSFQRFTFILDPTGAGDYSVETPIQFDLHSIHPNPFNNAAIISFTVDRTKDVRLSVFDINGRMVTQLIDTQMQPGKYRLEWKTDDLPAGFYFIGLESEGLRRFGKAAVIK